MLELTNEILEIAYTNGAARWLQLHIILFFLLSIIDTIVLAIGIFAVHLGIAALG